MKKKSKNIDKEELLKYASMFADQDDSKAEFTCCICGKKFKGYGNNPWPICDSYNSETKTIQECCNECNKKYVIAVRMGQGLPDWLMKKFNLHYIKEGSKNG